MQEDDVSASSSTKTTESRKIASVRNYWEILGMRYNFKLLCCNIYHEARSGLSDNAASCCYIAYSTFQWTMLEHLKILLVEWELQHMRIVESAEGANM